MELTIYAYGYVFATFAFVLGAVVGSFLNVCIYRMPLGLSVNEPRRSFCPRCKWQIPWHHNIPLLSWLLLRGRCANCGGRISVRYFGVELLTALLFLAVWLSFPWVLALPYWILVSLFIVATFIDFEHFIIPDEITWGGAAAGLVLSFAIPALMGVESHLAALLWSAAGAAAGYGLLWGVVEAGKLAFGKKRVVIEPAENFEWVWDEGDPGLRVGDELMKWSELFSRESDRLILRCGRVAFGGTTTQDAELCFFHDRLEFAGGSHPLEKIGALGGSVREIVIPREAMGFGDVKFMACIGAFLGWKAVLFTVVAASVVGALVGVTTILLRRREWSAKIPFGPYLAFGAMLWMFAGPAIVAWYLGLVRPPGL
jgi:leader peptidase (prepilin peptidase)/N-methyltransferase